MKHAARALLLRLTPSGRRRLALEHGALHSRDREPGLQDLDDSGKVMSDGINVAYYVAGPDAGTEEPRATVVYVHGFTLAAEAYFLQVKHTRRSHPEVRNVLLDLRGHGQTGKVSPDVCTMDGIADDVRAVIHHCAPTGPIILVGHSMGGLCVLNLLRRCQQDEPDLYARISGIILVSTSIEALSDQGIPQVLALPAADSAYQAVKDSSNKDITKVREKAAALLAPSLAVGVFKRPLNYEIVEFHAAMIHETPLESFVGFFRDLQCHDELAAARALAEKPGFVIVGDRDDVTPEEQADRICELWPRAWRLVAPEVGHMVNLEAPEVLNKAIDHLIELLPEDQPADSPAA